MIFLVLGEGLGDRSEGGGELGVLGLLREFLRPVEGQVEVRAAVVDLTDLAGRRTVFA